MAKQVKVRLVRSLIGADEKKRRIAESLGLRKRLQTKVLPADAPTLGKIEKVLHLLEISEA